MVKYFCDCCEKEIDSGRDLNIFEYLCHIDGILDHTANGYVDDDGNRISGRKNAKGLCISCYNRILIESVKKYRDMKNNFFVLKGK